MEKNDQSSKVGIILAVVVIAIGVGAAIFMLSQKPAAEESSNDKSSSSGTMTSDKKAADEQPDSSMSNVGSTVIMFTDDGFDKTEYTAKAGEAVTVKNTSSMDLQFSSDSHPTHRDHPELNEGVLSPGQSSTFTPEGKGSYGFHDHLHDQYTGTLIVE